MKPTHAHFAEVEYVLRHPFQFKPSHVELCKRFRAQHGV